VHRLLSLAPLAAVFAAFAAPQSAAPPTCTPATVTTAPGVAVAVAPNCQGAGANPTVTIDLAPIGGTLDGFPGTYRPSAGFNGVDHFRYTVTNTTTGETSAVTEVNIVVNSLPTCSDGTATTPVNTPLVVAFPCTDPDGNAVLIHTGDGQHGTVDPAVGTRITYTPEPGFVGTDTLTFFGSDGAFQTAERTLTITVTAAATPAPTATATPDASSTPAPTATATPKPLGSPSPAPAGDTTAPTVTVKAGKASIAKGVALTFTSSELATAKLTLVAAKTTTSKTTALTRGTTKLTLKLSAKARKALKAFKTVKATLTLVATDAAGNRATKKLSVTLKR